METSINSNFIILSLGVLAVLFFCAAIFLWLSLAGKDESLEELRKALEKMQRSFNELDEQAKLIIRTDLELNRAQEELDKRLDGLNALQRTSRQISQALNENEIFQRLSQNLFDDLGFAKMLIATVGENQIFKVRSALGFEEAKLTTLIGQINKDDVINAAVREKHTLSSLNAPRKTKERLTQAFDAEHFILSPILSQTGVIGFVLVGNRYNAPAVTQGDEELITILAAQIGQALENAQLFEKVFRSSQELEIKVKDRTKQLATALSKVEEISKKKSEFISAVSHELRTPLTSIKGYAAILIAGKIGELPEAVKERLAKINTHSDNLVGLINNLLDIARIESGRQEMKFAVYKPKQVIDNIVDLLGPQTSAKEINVVVQLPAEVPDIYIDISQAERVFINLMSNAIKFTPQGGTITLSASPIVENGYATFNVTDTGIGISDADMQKLFSEFFRVDNDVNQNVKGTGLGLVLAKNIVEAHGGRMNVKSQVGHGTSFSFTLPVNKAAFEARKETTA